MAATVTQFPEFEESTTQWTIYSERLEFYFVANDIVEKPVTEANAAIIVPLNNEVKIKKRAVLLTVLGPKTYTILRSLISPAKPTEKSYDELIEALTLHFDPVPSELVERSKFYQRNQKPDESVASFVSSIRKLAEFCDFGANLDEYLRDRLVFGINDDKVRKILLSETGLTLKKAIALAQSMETVERDASVIKSHKPESTASVNKISNYQRNLKKSTYQHASNSGQSKSQSQPVGNSNNRKCIRCLSTAHPEWECIFRNAECYVCHKIGHIGKACRGGQRYGQTQNQSQQQRKSQSRPQNHIHNQQRRSPSNENYASCRSYRGNNSNRQKANHIAEETSEQIKQSSSREEPLTEYEIFHVNESVVSSNKQMPTARNCATSQSPIKVSCLVNEIPLIFELDTGSAHTLVPENVQAQLPNIGTLEKSSLILSSFSGHAIQVKGQAIVQVTYNGIKLSLPLIFYHGAGPHLIGRSWIFSDFQMIQRPINAICHVATSQDRLAIILDKHKRVFSPGIGRMQNVKVKLHIRADAPTPRFHKARSVPYHLREKVDAEISRLEKENVISSTPYAEFATPIVPILKGNGTIRMCGDFKVTTNKIIDVDQFPIPKVEDIFAKLAGCKVFARLDLRNAYNQLELEPESRKYVVINTCKGLYQYNCLPFGIASASAIFQKHIEMVLQDHPQTQPFQDDIIMGGRNSQDLLKTLDDVLATLDQAGLKLNKDKCKFNEEAVDFLGYRLEKDGLHPQTQKLSAIRDAPTPRNVDELPSFVGLINYYGRFIPNASTLLDPFYKLMTKTAKWEWNPLHQRTFEAAKQAVQSTDLLVLFDPTKEVILACDASPVGLGAVISHQINGEERPIAFASRTLSSAEKNYPQIEREALSIIFAVTRFRDYLLGKSFTLVTDHKPLVAIFNENKPVPPMAAARLQRWALTLSAYNYKIVHKKGIHHCNADALSRLPLKVPDQEPPLPTELVLLLRSEDAPINVELMTTATHEDPVLIRVFRFIQRGWPSKSKLDAELLKYYKRHQEISIADQILLMGHRVIVPKALRKEILDELHSTHQGVRSMKELARSKVWWPGIDTNLDETSQSCEVCRENAPMPHKQFSPWIQENQPWRRVHLDFAGPIENHYLLITVDATSKWMEVDITKNTSSATVINCLRQHITRFGIMDTLVSDNATCFTSAEFRTFLNQNGIIHKTIAPYHPESNGQAERSVRTLKSTLKKITGGSSHELQLIENGLNRFNEGSLQLRIARFLMNYRRTPINGGPSPAESMFQRTIRTKLDLFRPQRTTPSVKQPYTKTTKMNISVYLVGQSVYARNFGKGAKWIPGHVNKLLGNIMVNVKTIDGDIIRRHRNQIRTRFAKEPLEKSTHSETMPSQSAISPQLPKIISIRSTVRHDSASTHLPSIDIRPSLHTQSTATPTQLTPNGNHSSSRAATESSQSLINRRVSTTPQDISTSGPTCENQPNTIIKWKPQLQTGSSPILRRSTRLRKPRQLFDV